MIADRKKTGFFTNPHMSKILLTAGVLTFIFYLLVWVVIKDNYSNSFFGTVYGAFFELLSIPALLCLITVPILAIIMLVKNKKATWLNVTTLLFIVAAFFILLTQS